MTPTGGKKAKRETRICSTRFAYHLRLPTPPPLQILIFAMQVPQPVKPISSGYYPIFGDPFNLINF